MTEFQDSSTHNIIKVPDEPLFFGKFEIDGIHWLFSWKDGFALFNEGRQTFFGVCGGSKGKEFFYFVL